MMVFVIISILSFLVTVKRSNPPSYEDMRRSRFGDVQIEVLDQKGMAIDISNQTQSIEQHNSIETKVPPETQISGPVGVRIHLFKPVEHPPNTMISPVIRTKRKI
eukprot:TRINITY_DN4268_c0_g1_i1.p1 TRINITY_DN4268_c0_g1~~TRINITY_DN4268_c0_g1_i1.p1  ORF type:complete len:120 (-),score=30.51 TRINITY_DN4268_c0_g1_i1:127-441(-)